MFHVEHSSIGIGVDPWVCASRLGLERASMRFPQTTRRAKKKSFCLFESKMCREFLDRTRILKSKGWCLRGFFLKMFHVEHSKIAGRSEYLNRECDDLSYWSQGWGLRSWETKSKGSGEKLSREKVWSFFENVPHGTFEHWNRSWSLSLRIVLLADWEGERRRERVRETRLVEKKCGLLLKMFHVEHSKTAGRWEYLNGERADSFWGSCW